MKLLKRKRHNFFAQVSQVLHLLRCSLTSIEVSYRITFVPWTRGRRGGSLMSYCVPL
ncbi:hypothetical protein CBOM_02245 [Ceraceosorus bombacis]|uniref:Uncharacterized protein n=1 Tax=Ceraceosorus bombacis TaxID=401625 RepID=A0A0N7L9P9_9BASI|nr:hypothetical protein CBOM_02245 [Ceraceosorus bombacis]